MSRHPAILEAEAAMSPAERDLLMRYRASCSHASFSYGEVTRLREALAQAEAVSKDAEAQCKRAEAAFFTTPGGERYDEGFAHESDARLVADGKAARFVARMSERRAYIARIAAEVAAEDGKREAEIVAVYETVGRAAALAELAAQDEREFA